MRHSRIATVWLSGCSGCHMSLLNLHGQLLELLTDHDLVYSPLMDIKEFPEGVDIVLVEGAVGNRDNQQMAEQIRQRSALVVSLGDCAVNGNVAGLRNPLEVEDVFTHCYGDGGGSVQPAADLLAKVLPLHQVIRVDAFIPGCPPESHQIMQGLERLIQQLDDQM